MIKNEAFSQRVWNVNNGLQRKSAEVSLSLPREVTWWVRLRQETTALVSQTKGPIRGRRIWERNLALVFNNSSPCYKSSCPQVDGRRALPWQRKRRNADIRAVTPTQETQRQRNFAWILILFDESQRNIWPATRIYLQFGRLFNFNTWAQGVTSDKAR